MPKPHADVQRSRPELPLARRHALVTGAGRGIGATIARRLARDGALLTLVGRQQPPLQALAEELGGGAQAMVCDVGDAASVRRCVSQATDASGAIQILVNNAGQAASAPVGRTSDALWQQMLSVNLTGTFLVTREALISMVPTGWGRVVNVASTAGQRGYPYVCAYVAAKHGVIGLTRALAMELATKGVTVNAVCPGYTDTELLQQSLDNVVTATGRSADAARAEFIQHNPQGRLVQAHEVADAVAWLCSGGAASINGQSLSVSGGEVT